MMKYFIDTEFIEGFHKPLFGKRRHYIDLISIGIVAEDGREYHAISNEYRYKDADQWVQDNVIVPLYRSTVHGFAKNHIGPERFHHHYGKSNKQIAEEIKVFVANRGDNKTHIDVLENEYLRNPPEFYGYYADYDWVLFCSLFGRMIDLPKGFPMYCRDLKQMLDEFVEAKDWYYGRDVWSNMHGDSIRTIGRGDTQAADYLASNEEKLDKVKKLKEYPKQTDEHNALADAKWNKELYHFIVGNS